MRIEKINLYTQNLVEEDGEYILRPTDLEEVPCVITNRALKYCAQNGIGKTGLLQDFITSSSRTKVDEDGDVVMSVASDDQVLRAIYTGYVGGQFLKGKDEPKHSFEDFINRYHDGLPEMFNLYQSLILPEINEFVKTIERSTDKTVGKGEKK